MSASHEIARREIARHNFWFLRHPGIVAMNTLNAFKRNPSGFLAEARSPRVERTGKEVVVFEAPENPATFPLGKVVRGIPLSEFRVKASRA